MVRRVALLALAVLAAMLVANVGSSAAEAPSPACPPPAGAPAAVPSVPAVPPVGGPAPAEILVCVGAQAITGASYAHWLTVAKKSEEPSGKGHPTASATELRDEVLGFLISSDWVKGEAADLGIRVSAAQVRKDYDHIRNQQFPKQREFKRFLRQSGEAVTDLMFRVELNLLSQRIQKRVAAGHRSASSKQRALSRFVKGFKAKWQAQTYCAAQYAVKDCGHVQETL